MLPPKVESVKRPLRRGEMFLVPCIVRFPEGEVTIRDCDVIVKKEWMEITPVINHPHSDKENGQPEVHFHTDYRFVKCSSGSSYELPFIKQAHSKHKWANHPRPEKGKHGELMYFVLPVINEDFKLITNSRLISKSKLKHHCIHKGKCPHRGYDLSQVSPIDGVITCPLHGLQFDAETKELTTQSA